MSTVLKVSGVSYSYHTLSGETPALSNITFSVPEGEFLAIVHGLALLKQKGSNIPIYSDSKIAQKWVRDGKCRTTLAPTSRNAELLGLVARAEKWLATNTYTNPIIKWETKQWGEIPADFGRKG